jgi:hypothetical protein
MLGSFQILQKICRDIQKSRSTTGINNTGSNLPPASTTSAKNLSWVMLGVIFLDTGGKFATGRYQRHQQ